MTGDPPSLCTSCAFVRVVHGRSDTRYLLCRNEAIAEKYPHQPVLACPGYDARRTSEDARGEARP